MDWIQLAQDKTHWRVVAHAVVNSRSYGVLGARLEVLPISVGTVSCCGKICDSG